MEGRGTRVAVAPGAEGLRVRIGAVELVGEGVVALGAVELVGEGVVALI